MKKLILSIAALVAFTFSGYSQCTPDPQFTEAGIYPDSATGLSSAWVGYAYEEMITIITPTDTVVDIPIFGLSNVTIDSVNLTTVTGLPPNFDYECDPPNCSFPGGTIKCARLYSTSNPLVADIGLYPIVFETTTYVSGVPLIGTTTQDDIIDYYFIEIKDSVFPTVSFNTSSVTVNESAGTITVDVDILDQNANPTTVDVVLGTSTATDGDDFTYTSPTTVTFPANSNTTQTVILTIIDDAIVELSEDIVLGLQNPTNGALVGTNDSYTVTITDNDVSANPLITFDLAALTVNENVGTVTVNVEILSANTNATSVDVVLGASTATNGDDFTYTSPTTVTFPASSSTTQTVTLTIIDDAILETAENIVLNLQNPTNSATIGTNGTQTITITDNDAAVVSFDASTVTVNENVGTVTVNVEILSANTNATSVDVVLGASTATNGDDFNYTSPTTVTFPAGVSTTQTVTLTIIDDAVFEANENIVLDLQNPTNGATLGTNGSYTVTITDNEPNEIVENSLESIVMYPNPTASGSITLKGINDQNVLIEISNIIGQVVYSNTVSANGIVNLTEVSKGTYIVTLFNDSDRISKKLIIE